MLFLNKITKTVNRKLEFCKLKAIFKTTNKLKNFFYHKDLVPEFLRSNRDCKALSRNCTASYVCKTSRHIKVIVSEHQDVLARTRKPVKGTLLESIRYHFWYLLCLIMIITHFSKIS